MFYVRSRHRSPFLGQVLNPGTSESYQYIKGGCYIWGLSVCVGGNQFVQGAINCKLSHKLLLYLACNDHQMLLEVVPAVAPIALHRARTRHYTIYILSIS